MVKVANSDAVKMLGAIGSMGGVVKFLVELFSEDFRSGEGSD